MFDLVPNDVQRSVVDSARQVAAGCLKVEPAARWQLVADAGLIGLGLPEEVGGVGMGLAEEMLALVELGAARVDPTLLAGVLGAHVLAAAETSDGPGLATVLDGSERLALADPWHWRFDADPDGDFRVLLPAGATSATWATVVTDAGAALLRLDELEPVTGFDREATIARARGTLVGSVVVELDLRALVLRSSLQAGLARQVLEIATEYAKVRHQFGRPIGSFQAVKHLLAGAAVEVDAAMATLAQAAVLIDAGHDAGVAAHAAAATAGRCAVNTVRTAIQVHGGIGVTDESDMHRFLRRAHLLEQLLGAPDFHEEWVLRAVS